MTFLRFAILCSLIANLILLLHISRINDNVEFLYKWNIIKTLRSDVFEARIHKLEEKK